MTHLTAPTPVHVPTTDCRVCYGTGRAPGSSAPRCPRCFTPRHSEETAA